MEFTKYNILLSELRSHVLSYTDDKELFNYAACSKFCNEEVQRRQIYFPSSIKIKEVWSGVAVTISYEFPIRTSYQVKYLTADGNKHKLDSSSTYVYDGDALQAATKHVKNCLKYARHGDPTSITIGTTVWPSELFTTSGIETYRAWRITFNESMYQRFYEAITETPLLNKELTLQKGTNNPYLIPTRFFESAFFQNLAGFKCDDPLPEMPVNSFLTMKAITIRMDAQDLPLTAIIQKFSQWLSNPPENKISYCFNRYIDRLEWNTARDTILAKFPVKHLDEKRFHVVCHLEHESGIKAIIEIMPIDISFETHI